MSVRNHSQSVQNESGQLNLFTRDDGTSNIYAHTRTLRFEPEGCLIYGPGSREVTINTAFAGGGGGGGVPAGDVVWEANPGEASSIQPKFAAPASTATGLNAVSHGGGNQALSSNSYTGGGNTHIITGTSESSAIIGGVVGNIEDSAKSAIIGGEANRIVNFNRSLIIGGTAHSAAADDTVYIGKHLEVGKSTARDDIGSITRISFPRDSNWEDGHLGNSGNLYFTPSDFITDTNGRTTLIQDSTVGPFVLTGGGVDGAITAVKILPKGFKVAEDADIEIYVASVVTTPIVPNWVGVGATTSTIQQQTMAPGAGTVVDLIGSPSTFIQTWSGGVSRTNATAETSVSDGTAIIAFHINRLAAAIFYEDGITGARVAITRV